MANTKHKYSRIQEIARDEIRLPEFIELTGVGVGVYGIYTITEEGVSVPALDDVSSLEPSLQAVMIRTRESLTFRFPLSAHEFIRWHKATESNPPSKAQTNALQEKPQVCGISDFPLPPGFREAVEKDTTTKPSVTSKEIERAFPRNGKWWDTRMRDALRYDLKECRAERGKAGRPSKWYPDAIAAWLIDKGHMERERVIKAVVQHFPQVDTDYL